MSPAASESAYPVDVRQLVSVGGEMSQDDRTLLEQQVSATPHDLESRIKLIGYYFSKGPLDADANSNKERHIVWLIENSPESEVLGLPYGRIIRDLEPQGYKRATGAWKKVLAELPENLAVLKNAAVFFLLFNRKLSKDLLLKGQSLDGENPRWADSLGLLYSHESMSRRKGESQKTAAKKAFEQYELAYKLSDPEQKRYLLTTLANSALAARLNDNARKFAMMILADDTAGWDRGNRIHFGHLVLGQLALADGMIDEAKSRLLRAGETSGSPQLNSFGPSMQLAMELLERGERETVLEYFELCKMFWKSGDERLNLWSDEVKANRIPEFGANLVH